MGSYGCCHAPSSGSPRPKAREVRWVSSSGAGRTLHLAAFQPRRIQRRFFFDRRVRDKKVRNKRMSDKEWATQGG